MEKIVKSWWFWAVAAFGVATLAYLSSKELPPAPPSAAVEHQPTDIAADLTATVKDPSLLPEKIALPVAAEPVALEVPDELTTLPENALVEPVETAAIADQQANPQNDTAAEALPIEQMSADAAPEEAEEDVSAVILIPEENAHQVEPRPEAMPSPEVPAADKPPAEDAPAPEVAIIEAENLESDSASNLEPLDEPAVSAPEVEASEAPPVPDPIQPALALNVPPLGIAPEVGVGPASAPAAETQPLLGESSPPLSLAQVLPPGEAPTPDQISPSFDLVRVSPDGSALIAGRAAPGAVVQVFSGTIPVAEATASARGEFVVFLNTPRNTTLDLQIPAAPEGAALVVSQEDIVILPALPDAADATPIVVHRTPDAVLIVQPSAPAVPLNVSLDMVSYADSGAVQLAGRGQPGNVARIYADGVLAGEAPIAQGGTWALEVSDIAEGRYVLRVDEITPTGEVLSRTESPFQRQFPEAQMPESFSQGAKIIVQPGNTLWLMATEAYGDGDAFSQIYTANKDAIRDPDLIYPGQIFSIPRIEE